MAEGQRHPGGVVLTIAEEREVELPVLGAPVADTHAHLDMLEDPVGALERAARAGVALIGTVVDLTEDPEVTLDHLDEWVEEAAAGLAAESIAPPEVHIVLGVHPHNARNYSDDVHVRLFEIALRDPRVRMLGELGLDFHYEHSPRDVQREMFARQLMAAHELCLPVCVHLREAHEEGIEILTEFGVPEHGCIIHCFTEGPQLAQRFVEMGCHISFAGPLTFPKAEKIRLAAALVPSEKVLVETDCPFLAPHPYRGARNEPALVVLTAQALAGATDRSESDVAADLMANARTLYCGEGASA